jgi:hypothetical protein
MRTRVFSSICLGLLSLAVLSGVARAAKPLDRNQAAETSAIDFFAAKDDGTIDVRLIPQDSTTGTVLIANKTDGPLTIRLPEAFAGVPVLAQRRGGGGGGAGAVGIGNGAGGGGGNQGVGGGFGGGGLGGGQGGGGGLFNIGPERLVKLKVVTVCLEHGKKDPGPRIAYDLVPLSTLTTEAAVVEVVRLVGLGEIPQPAGQAAAWHLANGLSWQELADKIGVQHLSGATEPYFSALQIQRGQRIALEARQRAQTSSPQAESLSQSNLARP